MQKINIFKKYVIAFFLVACSSTKETTGVSKQRPTDISFKKILIIAASVDIEERVRLENDLLAATSSAGYTAIRSLDVIPFSLSEPKIPDKEEINQKAKDNGCGAVLVTSILRKEDVVTVTKGVDTKENSQMIAGILGGILTKNSGHSVDKIPGVYRPASYSLEKGYFVMQSFLYEVATETIMYSNESPSFEISSLDKKRKEYMTALIAQLEKEKLLKK